MPQTEEHLQILTYLGVTRAVIALTKIDLAQDEQATISAIRARLAATPFADASIVPTSVISSRGLDDLKSALVRVLAQAPPPADIGKPRLAVDRVFKLQGIGTVVTGTLSGGSLKRGQSVAVQPGGKSARIRNIQSHGRDVEAIAPGSRTALNLSLDAVEDIHRGDAVTLAEFGGPSEVLDVAIEISSRATHSIKDGARVHAHHGSGAVAARVAFREEITLAPGQSAVAQLRLEAPAFAFAGDRFILRDWAERLTLGGGIVIDPEGNRRAFRTDPRSKFLTARAAAPADISTFVSSCVAYTGAARMPQLLVRSRFSALAITEAVAHLVKAGTVIAAGEWIVDSAKWSALRQKSVEVIDARHRAHPEESGVPLNDLRSALQDDLPAGEIFEPLVADLCVKDFIRSGAAIRRASHRAALTPQLQAAGGKIRALLAAKPLDPPSKKDLAPDIASQQALRYLIQSGELIDINVEIVMTADAVKQATTMVRDFIRKSGPATTSDLRQMLGNSRRVVIPLLERLDRDGVTVRQGDKRALRS
jgi:selenocysteine-specific elongation factor